MVRFSVGSLGAFAGTLSTRDRDSRQEQKQPDNDHDLDQRESRFDGFIMDCGFHRGFD